MDLLIDAGNSRIKWAYDRDGELCHHGSAVHGPAVSEVATGAWLALPKPARIWVANVAGQTFAEQLEQWLGQQWQLRPEYVRVQPQGYGLALAYEAPERFGVDRWLAILAARRLNSGVVAVVDAGTATTVDVVDANGWHLGGIIYPGLTLMAKALEKKSSGIQQGMAGESVPGASLLGRDTTTCIEKGALFAVCGAIEHLMTRLEQEMSAKLSVIICGGDAKRVMAELSCNCQYVPDLVLQGIQFIKGD